MVNLSDEFQVTQCLTGKMLDTDPILFHSLKTACGQRAQFIQVWNECQEGKKKAAQSLNIKLSHWMISE